MSVSNLQSERFLLPLGFMACFPYLTCLFSFAYLYEGVVRAETGIQICALNSTLIGMFKAKVFGFRCTQSFRYQILLCTHAFLDLSEHQISV